MGASSDTLGKASAGLGLAAAGVQAIPIFGQIAGAIMGGVSAGLGGAAAARARKEREEREKADALAMKQLNANVLGANQARPAGRRISVGGGQGVGVSFVPGPWSAIGAATTQVHGQGQGQGSAQTSAPTETPNASSSGQGQLQTNQQPQPQPISSNVLGTQQATGLGDFQSQMQSSIANLILKGDINDLGGV